MLERPADIGPEAGVEAGLEDQSVQPGGRPAFWPGACVCLANPSTWHAFDVAATPYLHLFQPSGTITTVDELSFFSAELRSAWRRLVPAAGILSGVMVASDWARSCLMFAGFRGRDSCRSRHGGDVGGVMHANAAFALVFAWTVTPNGQEWYQDRFGVQGRLGGRWTFWSTGGRLVTLALIFLLMSKDITGWGNTSPDIQFGLGYHPDSFTMEAADFLDRHNEIKGNILNTSMHQGDILIWKTASKRKTYVDGRAHLFRVDLLEQWRKTRKALSEDDVARWKPLLDKYEISAVMVEPADAPNTSAAAAKPELGAVL